MAEEYFYRQYRGKALGTGTFVKSGQWITGDLCRYSKDGFAINTKCENGAKYTIPVATASVGQQTGVKDRNGKETYEGDILTDREGKVFVIEPMPGGPCLFDASNYEDYLDEAPVIFYDALADIHTRRFVEENLSVDGNIIDNPDILTDYLYSISYDRN